jgi:hypothetical protein
MELDIGGEAEEQAGCSKVILHRVNNTIEYAFPTTMLQQLFADRRFRKRWQVRRPQKQVKRTPKVMNRTMSKELFYLLVGLVFRD